PKQPRIRWAIALAGFAVAVVAVVGAAILFGGSDSDVAAPETPAEVMALLGTAVEEADPSLTDLSPVGVPYGPGFLEWNLALGLNPEFDNCTTAGSGAIMVSCDVTAGSDYFFSTVLKENVSSTVTVRVDDRSFRVLNWPAFEGLADAEIEFRTWIQATHPELEGQMFGSDFAGVVRFDRTAGELHTQYLDEYLAYREANS
ncbi:MAG: hypothetical protein HKN80_04760, partial [Acidimicrobiia bacterium]|nr:hypothetical protein [Acidimicrobiia bacterium]